MLLLQSKPVVEEIKNRLGPRVESVCQLRGRPPRLAVVLVGDDPASVIYTRNKGRAAVELGMLHETIAFPASAAPAEVKAAVDRLNADPATHGILIQRPLPSQFNESEVLYWVTPEKDVDAFHPVNTGRLVLGLPCFAPCTPAGVMEILKHYNISASGKIACVIGRSHIVGKPMTTMLLKENATVIQCHTRTRDLPSMTSQADLLVVAAGRRGLIGPEHIKEGAVVVDVGMHRKEDGRLCGDVRFEEVAALCSAITPVPGGVGPMTIAMLLENTVRAAERA
ncbi:MAG: bifunctional 5,10-methylene-tetrahydrofolate dehydrogenase/5,10-methylene-tetrahydrofolate cyclohydrolase [Bdellovibrionales bacterium RIFOXYD1_FULL_53_11]|nr:MAG: bifunctional 5,10-methylene-tetrahydrofolate dehydrogenase/5,10-methylene-tetrahydrofolate cyclohydrolase [Bdellovibrionales bacterium RIFOXYD1_FULL_53_11]